MKDWKCIGRRSSRQRLAELASARGLPALACVLMAVLSGGFDSSASAQQTSDSWPQWRGPAFDSISRDEGLPATLDLEKNLLWKVPLPGPAGSSPVVQNGVTWLTSVNSYDKELVLIAIDQAGSILWQKPLGGENRNSRDGANSASPSPCTDGKHVWATTGQGVMSCFAVDGAEIWRVDLQERFGEFNIQFGMSSTPVLDNGRLYLQLIHGSMRDPGPGVGHVVCLDAANGDTIWHQERNTGATVENKHSYASPTIYRDGDEAFLLTHGGDFVMAHRLEDGAELWRCGGLNPVADYSPVLRFVSTPAVAPGMIVVPSAKSGCVLALKPGGEGDLTGRDEFLHWRLDRGAPDVASPLVHNGRVWFFRENGVVLCCNASDGDLLYQRRLLADQHRSTPVIAGDRIYIAGRDGTLTILGTGAEPEVLGTLELKETTTASPAIAGGRLYIRTFEHLWCFGG